MAASPLASVTWKVEKDADGATWARSVKLVTTVEGSSHVVERVAARLVTLGAEWKAPVVEGLSTRQDVALLAAMAALLAALPFGCGQSTLGGIEAAILRISACAERGPR